MSLQSKKKLVKIQPNKKSVKSSLPRRPKAKGRSKTQLKSKRSLRTSSQRQASSKKNNINFKKLGGMRGMANYIFSRSRRPEIAKNGIPIAENGIPIDILESFARNFLYASFFENDRPYTPVDITKTPFSLLQKSDYIKIEPIPWQVPETSYGSYERTTDNVFINIKTLQIKNDNLLEWEAGVLFTEDQRFEPQFKYQLNIESNRLKRTLEAKPTHPLNIETTVKPYTDLLY